MRAGGSLQAHSGETNVGWVHIVARARCFDQSPLHVRPRTKYQVRTINSTTPHETSLEQGTNLGYGRTVYSTWYIKLLRCCCACAAGFARETVPLIGVYNKDYSGRGRVERRPRSRNGSLVAVAEEAATSSRIGKLKRRPYKLVGDSGPTYLL